jgi:hypothetical protein
MGDPTDVVNDSTTVVALGSLIKRRALAMEISYGSGGFCVILRNEKRSSYGYSWDLADAIGKAISQLYEGEMHRLLQNYLDEDDEPTRPDINVDEVLGKQGK